MYTAINGIYENGHFILKESPPTDKKSKVVILFLEEDASKQTILHLKGIKLGSWEGKYQLPDNFNNPLEDLEEYT